jgi:putative phosphoribosyl transferase
MPQFANRREAGRRLAEAVAKLTPPDAVVLALPRGGVPVGYEVAAALGAPLDLLLVRKIGAPGHEEYGIGAVTGGAAPQVVIDRTAAQLTGASEAYIAGEVTRQLAEIERRRAAYGAIAPIDLKGRSVIVVDDGIATGGTVKAALGALAGAGATHVILAVPVAPREVLAELEGLCDEAVCLASPTPFWAVGAHYADFAQTSDEEVVTLLAERRRAERAG